MLPRDVRPPSDVNGRVSPYCRNVRETDLPLSPFTWPTRVLIAEGSIGKASPSRRLTIIPTVMTFVFREPVDERLLSTQALTSGRRVTR